MITPARRSRPFPFQAPTRSGLVGLGAFLTLLPGAAAQSDELSFTIDWHGALIGQPTPVGPPLSESDILFPVAGFPNFNPAIPPNIRFDGGVLGILNYPACLGHLPGDSCGVETDAISYGTDGLIDNVGTPYQIIFSTDEYARGAPGLTLQPSLLSEAVPGDSSGDVQTSLPFTNAPLPPGAFPPEHVSMIDGDGRMSPASQFRYPGVGLLEPNRPGFGLPNFPFDEGSNLDGVDIGELPDLATDPVFFSLDAGFPDPLIPGFPNSDSAAFQGARGADVLIRRPTGGPAQIWAQAQQLGLDLMGPGTDDLDALILAENGTGIFEPAVQLFDWLPGPEPGMPSDMLLFSVRRGSAVIGVPDSQFGLPIEPGDILTNPPMPGMPPRIFIAAENLGLVTERSNMMMGDDLNAGDDLLAPYRDCNNNGIEDAVDIATNTSQDVAPMNGIPDECEPRGDDFCFCIPASAPCSNASITTGCTNSTGVGGILDATAGSSSVGFDDLVLTSSQLPSSQFGLTFMGMGQTSVTLGAGRRCVGGNLFRYGAMSTGPNGTFSLGPGIVGFSQNNPGPGQITIGSTWRFQSWYRDPNGPCATSNVTNGWEVLFTL